MRFDFYLPGLATHYSIKGYAVCGTSVADKSRLTSDKNKVNCRKCVRTKAFREI